ncbi:MAG TPA: hypothetical protein VJJ53_02925 [Candidatus Nanoarchaeia archaeon]|nr:hypothetical protein [Candidatus Nanoarchaeia archaeon]
MITQPWAIAGMALTALAIAYTAALVKREIEKINLNIKDVIKGLNASLIGAGLLFLIIVIATIFIYKGGELSILYPIGATSYLWSVIFGYKLFKERLNMWKIMGVIVLLFGVTLVGLGI